MSRSDIPRLELGRCSQCGGALERGYLLGKQNRIRWSTSPQGMTIFHGVPLIRHEQGFWRKRDWWLYAPRIPAARCRACHLVMFAYNNDQEESPWAERWASAMIAAVFLIIAAVFGIVALMGWPLAAQMPAVLRVPFAVVALVMSGIAAIPLLHVIRSLRPGSTRH
jgi:hypothetical protein